jgi:hypothetical protein
MQQLCTPMTTPALALAAQDAVLSHFLRRSTYQVKATQQHGLNYVVVRRKQPQPVVQALSNSISRSGAEGPQKTSKTLVLMHGYGLGLGFFMSK